MSINEVLEELLRKFQRTRAQRERYAALADEARKLEESLSLVIKSFGTTVEQLEVVHGRDSEGRRPRRPSGASLRSTSNMSSLADAIEQVLDEQGQPLHFKDIHLRLRDRGVTVPGVNPENNITSHLSRRKHIFVNVGRGLWALKKWGESPSGTEPPPATLALRPSTSTPPASPMEDSDEDEKAPWEVQNASPDYDDMDDTPF